MRRASSAFQSTLPARGATGAIILVEKVQGISIHAPRTGSDAPPKHGGTRIPDFNPRSPHGERRRLAFRLNPQTHFNPRSPHGERLRAFPSILHSDDFNPRSPHGERRGYAVVFGKAGEFQSTLPARGATNVSARRDHCNQISIHAPRTGSDPADFCPADAANISIHAPRTGSDNQLHAGDGGAARFQSTLPARGATFVTQSIFNALGDFNPRSPHGERPAFRSTHSLDATNFNPRSPHGERLMVAGQCRAARPVFQSTLPARGATSKHTRPKKKKSHFNPRSPHGERPAVSPRRILSMQFQSTLPARGATNTVLV